MGTRLLRLSFRRSRLLPGEVLQRNASELWLLAEAVRPKPGPAETGLERRRAFLQVSGESKSGPPSRAAKELEGLWESVSAGP